MKIIAEIGLSHEGSLGQAMAYCDAVAKAGADVVKFQCHTGDPVSEFRPGTFFPQDENRQAYWGRTGFTIAEWEKLTWHARKKGLEVCVSIFSRDAIERLSDSHIDYWKLGSAQTSDCALIDVVARQPGSLILSSGMSDWSELDYAIGAALAAKKYPTVLQCTSEYPCPPEHVGLNIAEQIEARYKAPIRSGISDHSGTIWPSICAARDCLRMAEVHVCWHRECFGADVPASITIDELKLLVQGVRFIERMKPVDKDEQAKSMEPMRRLFRV